MIRRVFAVCLLLTFAAAAHLARAFRLPGAGGCKLATP